MKKQTAPHNDIVSGSFEVLKAPLSPPPPPPHPTPPGVLVEGELGVCIDWQMSLERRLSSLSREGAL